MHTPHVFSSSSSAPTPSATSGDAVSAVLREAKRLHRAAASDSRALSLPVLRRLLQQQVLQGIALPALRRQRDIVQRKHMLRLLAAEAGFGAWEAYRARLLTMSVADLAHFDMVRAQVGYPNLWFSTPEDAQNHVDQHGGRLMQVGRQAVVLLDTAAADCA
jgi:hypothetical protein